MVGLWAYAAGIGATNKYNQIKDEQRNLAGQKELERLQAKLNPPAEEENDLDPSLFSLKGTDISFKLPGKEEWFADAASKRSAHSNRFLNGILNYDADTWKSISDSSDPTIQGEYARMEREFVQSLKNYWKYEGTTDDQSPIYKSFDYEALKDVLPGLYDKISNEDPLHDPDQEYNPDFEKDWNIDTDGVKFGINSSMQDVVHVPYKFGKSQKANVEGFNNHYGIDFGKDVMMSGQYGSWSAEQYENAKANSPWSILIPTYMAMMDDDKVSVEEGRRSIVEMQLAHGLSDEALIKAMSSGVQKYTLDDHGGGRWVRKKVGKVTKPQIQRSANSRSASLEIVSQIDMMQKWIQEAPDTALGTAGWIRKFFKGTIGDDNSQINQLRKFISTARGSNSILWAGTTFDEQQKNRDGVIATLEKGLTDMEQMYADHNIGHIKLWNLETLGDKFRGKTVTQSMITTLSIGLAFQIALTEQGSGGKAVSDQDFNNAIKRIEGDWFTSKSQALGSLNVEKHKFAQRYLKEDILSRGDYQSHGNNLLADFESIVGAREEYLLDLQKDFITVGAVEFAGRTQRLLDMYTSVGGSQDGVLFPGSGEVVAKTKGQQFGKRPDVLRDEGFQSIFSQVTDTEKVKIMTRLGTKENLEELLESIKKNKKAKTVIESFQDYEKISKGFSVPNPVKGSNAVDFTHRLLNENPNILLKEAIDLAIGRYQKDNISMFRDDIDIAFEDEEAVRMYILKQWIIKHQKNPNNMNIYQRTIGQTGAVSNPENEDAINNIYGKLWGQK